MKDRRAPGTEKILAVCARAVEIKLPKKGPVTMQASRSLKISSMCATFFETYVISLLAETNPKPDVFGRYMQPSPEVPRVYSRLRQQARRS